MIFSWNCSFGVDLIFLTNPFPWFIYWYPWFWIVKSRCWLIQVPQTWQQNPWNKTGTKPGHYGPFPRCQVGHFRGPLRTLGPAFGGHLRAKSGHLELGCLDLQRGDRWGTVPKDATGTWTALCGESPGAFRIVPRIETWNVQSLAGLFGFFFWGIWIASNNREIIKTSGEICLIVNMLAMLPKASQSCEHHSKTCFTLPQLTHKSCSTDSRK